MAKLQLILGWRRARLFRRDLRYWYGSRLAGDERRPHDQSAPRALSGDQVGVAVGPADERAGGQRHHLARDEIDDLIERGALVADRGSDEAAGRREIRIVSGAVDQTRPCLDVIDAVAILEDVGAVASTGRNDDTLRPLDVERILHDDLGAAGGDGQRLGHGRHEFPLSARGDSDDGCFDGEIAGCELLHLERGLPHDARLV